MECKKACVVGCPAMASSPSSPKPMNVKISDGMGDTSTGPNLSAKFKNPRVKQDVPDAGKNQYE
jgi:hypothetical protein